MNNTDATNGQSFYFAGAPTEITTRGNSNAPSNNSLTSTEVENNSTNAGSSTTSDTNLNASQNRKGKSKKKTQSQPRSKHWCFTLNNYTETDIDRLSQLRNTPEVYLIYGKEVGESGTPHLQGFVSFPSRKRLNQVISVLGQCHCSIARYITQSIQYCKKEGDYTEFGTAPTGRGGRTDLAKFKEYVKANKGKNIRLQDIREEHSVVYARYPRFCKEYINDNKETKLVDPHPLRTWQANLASQLAREPDKRKIIFLVDLVGNSGKSWFFQYHNQLHKHNSQIILPGKKADMAYTLKDDNRVVMFDCPRSKQGEFIQYDFLEEVKNGYVFSSKYESGIKRFKPPHVVVAMNEFPDMEKLSQDRYEIIELRGSSES